MFARRAVLWIVFVLLCITHPLKSFSQPALPDIAAAANNGIVVLSWTSPYSAIKSVNVLRSADSVGGFQAIGSVKKVAPGVQAFVDGHPVPGKNYYKLIITFKSGLTWSSNHCSVYIASTAPAVLPPNDSLQRYLVTDTVKTARSAEFTKPAPAKDILSVEPEDADEDEEAGAQPAAPKRKVYISFNMDSTHGSKDKGVEQPGKPFAHKIVVSFDEPGVETPTFIKSQYIFTDQATGHVHMNLPDDVATHHYSVAFYDLHNHMVTEVPKINNAHIIFDKRNFQHKGTYKFILRRDALELEQGYIIIN